jgi:hypothetical protein
MTKPNHNVTVGNVTFANDAPLALIAGPASWSRVNTPSTWQAR